MSIRKKLLIILIFILFMFINPLVFGFLHRYVSLGIESFLILLIALGAISIMFDLRLRRFKLALLIFLSACTAVYYYSKPSLVYFSEKMFFEKRENQLTKLAEYLIK